MPDLGASSSGARQAAVSIDTEPRIFTTGDNRRGTRSLITPSLVAAIQDLGQLLIDETESYERTALLDSEGRPAEISDQNIIKQAPDSGHTIPMEVRKEYTKDQWQARLNEIQVPRPVLNNLIMNYLINEGYQSSAIKFAREAGVESSVDLSSIKSRMKIKSLINAGKVEHAIELINDIEPELLDTNPGLHFELLRLQLIELIREIPKAGDMESTTRALDFASTHLAHRAAANSKYLQDLEWTMALLCFPKDQLVSPLHELMDVKLRWKVSSKVNEALLEMQGIAGTSHQIHNLIKLWLWGEQSLSNKLVYFPGLTKKDLS